MPDVEIPSEAKDRGQKLVGLTIAILAVLLAVVSSLGNQEDNEKIVSEVKSSNHYAWYQAKRIREAMNDLAMEQMQLGLLSGNATQEQKDKVGALSKRYSEKNKEYKVENADIQKKAGDFMKQGELSGKKGDRFDLAEVFLQIAVVLCSVTLLTDLRLFFRIGVVVSIIGVAIGITAFSVKLPAEEIKASPKAGSAAPITVAV